ncbi:universal stress protein [Chitinophaga oryziterrae]|uniref:Universal stress protein n=1 Tax=Chitinophaga oryziterrae TaxID=1031224 RepID=A0A6N8JCK2_9BACT|nr:universal stress protein [Chitinophaga oryziterrae]MVT43025.1 universal stress protein [Chitinophaga oryziterrae]
MKKIIAAFDGLKFSQSTIEYAVQLGLQNEAHIVGVFLEDETYSSRSVYQLYNEKEDSYLTLKQLAEQDLNERDQSVAKFESACQQAGLNYTIHRDKGIALSELVHESIFADLLIIDANETLNRYTEAPPTHFISELLTQVQCPVLLVPKHYTTVRKVNLLYDGTPVSIYAIKMFSYLLPVLNDLPTEVITVKSNEADLHLPDNKLMKEFMRRHNDQAAYTVLKGQPEIEIPDHLRKQGTEILIVLGAYQRSFVSRLFRPSMADILVQELQWPLFIAHNK